MVIQRRILRTSISALFVMCGTVSSAKAGAFLLEHQNAAALGRAFAGAEAVTQDVAYIAYNPASLAGASWQVSVTASGVIFESSVSDASGALLGSANIDGDPHGSGVVQNGAIPNITIGGPLNDDLSIGIVVNAPFGLRTSYPDTSVLRYAARDSDLTVVEATPTIAYQLTNDLSIGAGLRIQYVDFGLSSTIDVGGIASVLGFSNFGPQTSDAVAEFDGTNVDVGYTVGAQYTLFNDFTVGVAYDSRVAHALEGDAMFGLSGSAAAQSLNSVFGLFDATSFTSEFSLPASLSVGVSADLGRTQLFVSGKRTVWSSFDVIELEFDGVTPAEVLTQNFRNTWQVSVGADYKLSDSLTTRLGVMWDQTPVNAAFASPRIPDTDKVWLAAGFSKLVGEKASLDFGLAYAFFEDRPIEIDGALPENLFRGSAMGVIDVSAITLSGTFRYSF